MKLKNESSYLELGFKQLVSRLIGHSFIYACFNLIAKVGGFFLFPLYWRFMSPEDFGIIGLVTLVQSLATSVMTLSLETSVSRFYHEWPQEKRHSRIGSLWTLSLTFGLTLAVAATLFGKWIFPLIITSIPFNPWIPIALWTAFFQSVALFPFMILRITERIHFYGMASTISFFAGATLSICFVTVLRMGAKGFLLANLATAFLMAVFWFFWMLRQTQVRMAISEIREEIRFALPSIPVNFIVQLDAALDRLYLDKLVTLGQIGIYSLGKKFGDYFNQVNQSLKTAWIPMTYKMAAQRNDFQVLLPKLSLVYFHLLATTALTTSLFAQEFIEAFGKEKYQGVYPFVPTFVLGFFFLTCGTAWGRGMDLAKKPLLELFPTIGGALSNAVLLWILVPVYHLIGASVAFAASCFTRTTIQVFLAHKVYPRSFPILSIGVLTALLLGAFAIGFNLSSPSFFPDIPIKTGIVLAYGGLGGSFLYAFHRPKK
jgi:O-antigen/teichoic acid export membrane protein